MAINPSKSVSSKVGIKCPDKYVENGKGYNFNIWIHRKIIYQEFPTSNGYYICRRPILFFMSR